MTPDALREVIVSIIRENTIRVSEYQVRKVNPEDNTVDLVFGDGVVTAIPCASSYPFRAPGDRVLVMEFSSGNWQVIAKAEANEQVDPLIQADLDAAMGQAEASWPAEITVTFGADAVPVTHRTGAIGIRDLGEGRFDIYMQSAGAAASRKAGH